jgi:hypothetical protein
MIEAPLIVENGKAYELTKDHFTPKCIAKKLGWSWHDINAPENIQWLTPKEHRNKDQTTPWELQAVKRNGGAKTLFEHHNEYVILRRGMPEEGKL